MAALAIQKQSLFHSKIVLLGRPKRFIKRFALIITPAQFQTPNNKQILPLTFPLIRINQSRIAQAGSKRKSLFDSLSRPITAVLVGGQTDPFRFDGQVADQLMRAAIKAAGNGCLYITTSRRTPQVVIDRIKQQLPENAKLFCWSADNQDNPYQALLALADRFIVTGDSISMMIEVAQLAKPLAIFELPYQNNIGAWFILTAQRKTRLSRLCKPFIRALQTIGLLGYTRDLTIIHQLLYQRGLATPLEEGFPTITDEQKIDFELDRVVTRIKQLFDDC